jgi:c(7)-type cytochrome triheme protein
VRIDSNLIKYMRLSIVVLSLLCVSIVFAESFGTKKRAPKPDEYGTLVINNYSKRADMAPVVFTHWLHRAQYTCRLCHVDLGFAMEAGQTGIQAADNRNGLYCGACHDGKQAFLAYGPEHKQSNGNCDRCHSAGKQVAMEYDFYEYIKGFPPSRFGNRVDWLKSEEQGYIKRDELRIPKDIELDADDVDMPDIIFSHEKHAVWNGCELCHPQIFNIKKSSTVFEMQEIFDGKYCGACHGKVAFTNMDCQLCHSGAVY